MWLTCIFCMCSGNGGSTGAGDPEAVPMLPLISPRDRDSSSVPAAATRKTSSASSQNKPNNPAPPRLVEISQPPTADSVSVKDIEPLKLGQYCLIKLLVIAADVDRQTS